MGHLPFLGFRWLLKRHASCIDTQRSLARGQRRIAVAVIVQPVGTNLEIDYDLQQLHGSSENQPRDVHAVAVLKINEQVVGHIPTISGTYILSTCR